LSLGGSGDQRPALAGLPQGKGTSVPVQWEAGWVPEPVWNLWRRKRFLVAGRNRSPIPVAYPGFLFDGGL